MKPESMKKTPRTKLPNDIDLSQGGANALIETNLPAGYIEHVIRAARADARPGYRPAILRKHVEKVANCR